MVVSWVGCLVLSVFCYFEMVVSWVGWGFRKFGLSLFRGGFGGVFGDFCAGVCILWRFCLEWGGERCIFAVLSF
jgi:hypothetical protein